MLNQSPLSPFRRRIARAARSRRRRLLIEALEKRSLLATLTVTSLTDVVNPADDATVFTLREAMNAANASSVDDTIQFTPVLTANNSAAINITNGGLVFAASGGVTTVVGPGAHLLAIDRGGTTRVLRVVAGATLNMSVLTIRNGSSPDFRGGLRNLGVVTLDAMAFQQNQAATGGRAISTDGTLQVSNSSFRDNVATNSGGAINMFGHAVITNSSFSHKSVRQHGGAINVSAGTTTIVQSTISVLPVDGANNDARIKIDLLMAQLPTRGSALPYSPMRTAV